MKIDLFVNRAELETLTIEKHQTAVIIDVLRATTTMLVAFANGVNSIIPVATVEEARQRAGEINSSEILLGGERNETIIEGFDLSNSPLEYVSGRVKGKSIIFTSTNGSQLFKYAAAAAKAVICSFLNVSKVSEFLIQESGHVAILCAGKYSQFAIEDVVCGGMLIQKIAQKSSLQLNDGAQAALKLYQVYADDLFKMLRQCTHGKRLIEIGQEQDLRQSAVVDSVPIVPVWQNGQIVAP